MNTLWVVLLAVVAFFLVALLIVLVSLLRPPKPDETDDFFRMSGSPQDSYGHSEPLSVTVDEVTDILGRPAFRFDVASDKYTCDTCDRRLNENEGYLLTTKQVVVSDESWRRVFLKWKSMYPDSSPDMHLSWAFQRASSDTPWVVCENCASMFSFNPTNARNALAKYRQTGEYPRGQAVCTVTIPKDGGRTVVEPTDDQAWQEMLAAINRSLMQIE
ncbi:MAG TPA: hypothetical protein EYP04_04950 [Anaerolineae bacterium]|nr:hypothetical protein [Anaerolineae bacterium]